MEIQLGRPNAQHWRAHKPTDASDIVVQVTDILYQYVPPDSGVAPEAAVETVHRLIDSDAGMAAFSRPRPTPMRPAPRMCCNWRTCSRRQHPIRAN